MPRQLPVAEFVALMAMLFAMVAFSIDAMLPGLPQIAADLSPDAPNRAQLVLTSFMIGMGLGTFFSGPLADAFGRRRVVVGGIGIFIIGAWLAYIAQSLEMLLAARVLQGIGVAGPRIAPLAMVRDLFEGRRMAQITSFIMTVFMLVPAAAPYLGSLIIDAWNWRAIFLAIILFGVIGASWLMLRQDETLAVADRRAFRFGTLKSGLIEVIRNRQVMGYVALSSLGLALLVALLSSTQQIYGEVFNRADSFPKWFAATALIAALGTLLNAFLVVRIGMQQLVMIAFATQASVSLLVGALLYSNAFAPSVDFALWFFWSTTILFCVGLRLAISARWPCSPWGISPGWRPR